MAELIQHDGPADPVEALDVKPKTKAERKRGEGRVFLRGETWWCSYYHNGREIRESAKTTDERKAWRLLRERLRKAGTPEFIGPAAKRVTFADLTTLLLTDYRLNGRRSIVHAERHTRRLADTFGMDRALDITAERIGAYTVARLQEGAKPASVNRELAALRRMFALAVKAGRLPHRPHIAMLAEDNAREGFLEPADFEAVRAHLPPDLADAATFAYLDGWRKGEVRSLEWRDVALERADGSIVGGVIRLRREHSKNKRGRVLVLQGALLEVIARRAAARRLDCVHVFHRDGRPLGDFRKAWSRACAAAGLCGQLFHDMRRSAVRNMVRAGVPERVAMAISGHKTRAVFDRYNIVSEADLAEAATRVSGYVAARRDAGPSVTPLRPPQEDGQNTDNRGLREERAAGNSAT